MANRFPSIVSSLQIRGVNDGTYGVRRPTYLMGLATGLRSDHKPLTPILAEGWVQRSSFYSE
jgi:hypothetical protein